MLATLVAAAPATGPADPTALFRDRFAIAGKLDVVTATVKDESASDGAVSDEMTCRPTADGTFTFRFDPYDPAGQPRTVTLAWPPPSPKFAPVRPGGIHGGPPRVGGMAKQPSVDALVDHRDQIVVGWTYADSAGRPSRSGYKLAQCAFAAPATRPAER